MFGSLLPREYGQRDELKSNVRKEISLLRRLSRSNAEFNQRIDVQCCESQFKPNFIVLSTLFSQEAEIRFGGTPVQLLQSNILKAFMDERSNDEPKLHELTCLTDEALKLCKDIAKSHTLEQILEWIDGEINQETHLNECILIQKAMEINFQLVENPNRVTNLKIENVNIITFLTKLDTVESTTDPSHIDEESAAQAPGTNQPLKTFSQEHLQHNEQTIDRDEKEPEANLTVANFPKTESEAYNYVMTEISLSQIEEFTLKANTSFPSGESGPSRYLSGDLLSYDTLLQVVGMYIRHNPEWVKAYHMANRSTISTAATKTKLQPSKTDIDIYMLLLNQILTIKRARLT